MVRYATMSQVAVPLVVVVFCGFARDAGATELVANSTFETTDGSGPAKGWHLWEPT